MEQATAALEKRPAAAVADPPAGDRPDLVTDDSGDDDGDVRAETRRVPAEHVDAMRKSAGGECAAVDHHRLARRGEHSVYEH